MSSPFDLDNTLFVTIWRRPHGNKETTAISKVLPEDVVYFNENKINVGMEDCGAFFALYASKDGFEEEVTELVKPDSECVVGLTALRKLCEKMFELGEWE